MEKLPPANAPPRRNASPENAVAELHGNVINNRRPENSQKLPFPRRNQTTPLNNPCTDTLEKLLTPLNPAPVNALGRKR